MNTLINKIGQSLLFVAVAPLIIISCKKTEEPGEFNPNRMFTPVNVKVTSGETQVKLEWNPSLFSKAAATKYTVEVMADSTLQSAAIFSSEVESPSAIITEDNIDIKKKYFARIRANATDASSASNWVISNSFMITGEQIFQPIAPATLKDKSVELKWRPTTGITKIVLTPQSGTPVDIAVTADEVTAATKLLTGLTPSTDYRAEIFAGTKLKGTITFKTKEPSIFTIELAPGADLVAAIANAANNDVIGLAPGTYDVSAVNLLVEGKHVTIQSISGDYSNTKVLFKEVTLKGTGAGVKISGIEFDGTPGAAGYFINLDADPATFTSILVENSKIHGTANSLIRGNRAGNNAQKIDFIKFDNNIIYDNGSGGFDYILLDKMEFNRLEITRSTFYNAGRRLISWATNITAPKPVILIDGVTINGLGYGGRDNVFLDANANPVDFTLRNSIIANIPKDGQTVGANAFRASSASSAINITNNNMFKVSTGGPTPAGLNFAVAPANNKTVDLGWTHTTTSFGLPTDSELRTSSTTGGPIGDPRWH
jgi:Domain of unknown function (DUF4957)